MATSERTSAWLIAWAVVRWAIGLAVLAVVLWGLALAIMWVGIVIVMQLAFGGGGW